MGGRSTASDFRQCPNRSGDLGVRKLRLGPRLETLALLGVCGRDYLDCDFDEVGGGDGFSVD